MAEPRTRNAIAVDYRNARAVGNTAAMARCQNEEACLVLLTILERLASDPSSFIHRVAVKGGILMAGELRSPRVSADIDATSGLQKRIDDDVVVREIRRAGREFNARQDREAEQTPGGSIVHLRFDSLRQPPRVARRPSSGGRARHQFSDTPISRRPNALRHLHAYTASTNSSLRRSHVAFIAGRSTLLMVEYLPASQSFMTLSSWLS
jgi:hypothetical protein